MKKYAMSHLKRLSIYGKYGLRQKGNIFLLSQDYKPNLTKVCYQHLKILNYLYSRIEKKYTAILHLRRNLIYLSEFLPLSNLSF